MKALIIAAHGSRKPESARDVAALTDRVREKAGSTFDHVAFAFIQFSEPLLPDLIRDLAAQGAKQVKIFPFFIAAGSHILEDIPEIVAEAAKAHPGIDFSVSSHLGVVPGLEDLIIEAVRGDLAP